MKSLSAMHTFTNLLDRNIRRVEKKAYMVSYKTFTMVLMNTIVFLENASTTSHWKLLQTKNTLKVILYSYLILKKMKERITDS